MGTIIPQNDNPYNYLRAYGDIFYRLFNYIDLFDMYHSLWFRMMLFMLSVNIVVCTFKRLPNIRQIVFKKNLNKTRKFKKFSQNLEFISNKDFKTISESCFSAVLSEFKKPIINKFQESIIIYAEKGGWARIGVHVVHLSIVLLFIGGLLGSIFGFEGYVNIVEGNRVNQITLKNVNKIKTLDFEIQCDSFGIKFHENGVPKEYKSEITIIQDGSEVVKKSVVVNDPLLYNGINIFQSSYGKTSSKLFDISLLPQNLIMEFKSKVSGINYTKELKFGIPVDLPENMGRFCILEYLPSANFKGIDLGGAFKCIHSLVHNESSEILLLPIGFPNFDLMRDSVVVVSLSNQLRNTINNLKNNGENLYYTGLQITKDPGKLVVYTAFFLIIFGFIVALFITHKRVYVKIEKIDKKTKIIISGLTNRNKLSMEMLINKIHYSILSHRVVL